MNVPVLRLPVSVKQEYEVHCLIDPKTLKNCQHGVLLHLHTGLEIDHCAREDSLTGVYNSKEL